MAERLHPNDLLGARVYWLLDLQFAGMTLRLSDGELDVETEDGDVLHYSGGLDTISVDDGIDFLADASANPTSASIDAYLGVDVPKLVAQGHDLGAATGTLARWVEGTTYEARRRVVVGRISDPEHGNASEPVSFTLEATPWADSKLIPDVALTVTGTNLEDDWILSLPSEALGLCYPVIIGHPGVVSTAVSSSGMVTGSQAVPVWLDATSDGSGWHNVLWIVAGHHCTANRVYQNSPDFTTAVRTSLFNGYDRKGHPVCYIPWWGITQTADPNPEVYPYVYDAGHTGSYAYNATDSDGSPTYCAGSFTGPSAGAPPDDANDNLRSNPPPSVFIAWNDDIDGGGGLAGNDGELMRDAGSVLEWLLGQSGAPIDLGRFAAAKPFLSAFKFDFTIDSQTTPWEFVQANLLPLLPVSIVSGPDGLFPVVWRYDATSRDSLCHFDLESDPYIERASTVSFDRENVYNDFSLKYALSVRVGEYQAEARLSATDEDGALPSYHCFISQQRYKRADGSSIVSTKSIESACIYDDNTAQLVLGWMARAYALARRRVDYIAPEAVYGWLERGQVVTITDPDLYLTDQVAIIESIKTDGSPMLRFKLLIIEELPRDSRKVS